MQPKINKFFKIIFLKKFVVFLLVSLERKKRCSVLNVKMCTSPCYSKTGVYTTISMSLSQNILYVRPSLFESLNKYIVKRSVSKF